jgi:hypothetical protein
VSSILTLFANTPMSQSLYLRQYADAAGQAVRDKLPPDHGHAKLTEEQVLEIRALAKEGAIRHIDIASRFGVSRSLISLIHSRNIWSHLP